GRPARFRGNCSRMLQCSVASRFSAACAVFLCFSFFPASSPAQETSAQPGPPLLLDSASTDDSSAGASSSNTHAAPDPADLEVSWRKMPARFLHDEKDMWLFPVNLGEGKNRIPTAIVVSGARHAREEDSAEQAATGS